MTFTAEDQGAHTAQVDDLGFSYRTHKVLDDIRFAVEPGEILGILGPNGVGKSTLLKCINLIHRPDGGTIYVSGHNVLNLTGDEIAKNIGYVAQRNEGTRMTVFDAVLLGRKPHMGLRVSEKDYRIVKNALSALQLTSMQLRYIDELSGGELQRVCICRAIVQKPALLLLDEPTSSLDLYHQMEILKLVQRVVQDRGVAAVLTMHDLNLALRFCDRCVFMKDGKIHASCTRDEVTAEMIQEVYGLPVRLEHIAGIPVVVPE